MKGLDRLGLIDRIGRELQARMSYVDIDAYLKALGVDVHKPTSGINSKWVYTKELLADVDDAVVLKIANELEIPHNYTLSLRESTVEVNFWAPHHFRLCLWHLSRIKDKAGALQKELRRFGISAFVAHVDIEPTREWQNEIEAGLRSMDALAAILNTGFKESDWTDQEVGVAVGRGVLVIPIIRDLNPYGFIGKYQGLQASRKRVSQVANEVFGILVSSHKTRSRMLTCLVDTTLQSVREEDAREKLSKLRGVEELPSAYLERLRDGAATATVFAPGRAREELNELLLSRGLQPVPDEKGRETTTGVDLPF